MIRATQTIRPLQLIRYRITPNKLRMSSSSTSHNAAGLTAQESKKLAERTPSPDEGKIIKAIRELYSCQPTESTYDIYARDAVFHDPVGIAEGIDSIKAQFNGLAKIFSNAQITQLRSEPSFNTLTCAILK
ncbi:hypothetical protein FRC02_006754 [Tulasnella sp. 418]|nr:hypothetical protein FRC02_006754 [Tulasnella sp. 418]